jgi:hypothetical protein
MTPKIIFALMIVLITETQLMAAARDTEVVLNLLLAASNVTIPPQSSCSGEYGQAGPAKLKDLLAAELAGFNRGKNTIVGSCPGKDPRSCSVLIRHEYGEGGYAAEIRFNVSSKGVIDVNTLNCIISP